MNYLNLLPVEIWQKIFVEVAPFIRVPANPSKRRNVIGVNDLEAGWLQAAQINRLELLTLCRSLYPLIEQLLYTEIVLKGSKRIDKFIDAAMNQQEENPRRSEWTRSIFILAMPIPPPGYIPLTLSSHDAESSSTTHNTPSLFSLCPRLEYFSMDSRSWGWDQIPRTLRISNQEASSIKVFSITPNFQLFDILRIISTEMPQLEQLNVMNSAGDLNELKNNIIFPVVRYATILQPGSLLENVTLTFPSLRQLALTTDRIADIGIFLRRSCSTLVELELQKWMHGEAMAHSVLPDDLFTICQQLKKLKFVPTTIQPPAEATHTPHRSLQELVLSMHSFGPKCKLEENGTYFSRRNFPNLSTIVCHIRKYLQKEDALELQSMISPLFPSVKVKLEFDYVFR